MQFYNNQIDGGFMTRGNANEQFSPSHSQWWLTAALGLRWVGWERRASNPDLSKKLLDVTGRWLGHHHALCRLFATNDGIVAPGARAWPQPEPGSGKPYYGKCKQRDVLDDSIETGRVKKLWPSDNLDMLGLIFADRLLKGGDDLGGAKTATDLPKLRWPVSFRRLEGNFTGWLTSIDGNAGLEVQRLATWRGGQDSYGFNDAVEDVWEGTELRLLGEKAGIGGASGTSSGGRKPVGPSGAGRGPARRGGPAQGRAQRAAGAGQQAGDPGSRPGGDPRLPARSRRAPARGPRRRRSTSRTGWSGSGWGRWRLNLPAAPPRRPPPDRAGGRCGTA